jgi:cell division protein FtsZ
MPDALRKADEVLQQGVQGITDLINVPGLINLDFADVQTVMKDKGVAHIGIGVGKGDDKCIDAVKQAITSPLLETTIQGASHVIINISGDISLIEANDAATYVQELAGETANIIFGAMYDETSPDEATITVIATGLEETSSGVKPPSFINNSVPKNNFQYRQPVSPTSNPVHNTAKPASTAVPVSRPVTQSTMKPVSSNTEAEHGGIKIPEFLQKNRNNK